VFSLRDFDIVILLYFSVLLPSWNVNKQSLAALAIKSSLLVSPALNVSTSDFGRGHPVVLSIRLK
jgi:hypothetical protein